MLIESNPSFFLWLLCHMMIKEGQQTIKRSERSITSEIEKVDPEGSMEVDEFS